VLEVANELGEYAGKVLAGLGADVVKVEAPEGDETRRWGPPFVRRANGGPGDAAYFHSCNRGKRSIVADFRTPEGQKIVHALAARSDVLVENFKTDGLKQYGLDYASLSARNPRLIYYTLGQWPKLTVFLKHGEVPLDNNRCESAIRPFVVGRWGWLFSDTVAGAKASANLFSFVETCKANGIEPHAYLSLLFARLPRARTIDDFESMLPCNAKISLAAAH